MKREYFEIMNTEEEKITRSKMLELLTKRYGIPEFDAKDILQDAWLVLLEKLMVGTLTEKPKNLLAYMTSICINKAHEYLRKRTYENLETSLDDESILPERLDLIQKEIQSWIDFIEESEKAQQRKMEAIEQAIRTLNPRQRALLEGYYYDKRTMRELAQQLGYSSEDVAKSTKNRIIKTIRETIKQQERANQSRLSPAAFLKVIVRDAQDLPEVGWKGNILEHNAVAEQRSNRRGCVACNATTDTRHKETHFRMFGSELRKSFHSAS
jgi:RNA polymerase sigma factor (sigma-70 family)